MRKFRFYFNLRYEGIFIEGWDLLEILDFYIVINMCFVKKNNCLWCVLVRNVLIKKYWLMILLII